MNLKMCSQKRMPINKLERTEAPTELEELLEMMGMNDLDSKIDMLKMLSEIGRPSRKFGVREYKKELTRIEEFKKNKIAQDILLGVDEDE